MKPELMSLSDRAIMPRPAKQSCGGMLGPDLDDGRFEIVAREDFSDVTYLNRSTRIRPESGRVGDRATGFSCRDPGAR
jgi:hypothetical protein